jgi:L-threonylcarbamoyladenylate synthase
MIVKKDRLDSAVKTLNEENLIIYPTDTLYGLGADATNTSAIKKINEIKNRNTPLSIMISDIKNIEKYAEYDSNTIKQIEKILPGPFTILLKAKKSNLSYLVQNDSKKIGIRIPNHKFCLQLLKKYKKPIITTSVNTHGTKNLNNIEEIEQVFLNINIYKGKVNKKSKGSTIIDFTKIKPEILREGDGKFTA